MHIRSHFGSSSSHWGSKCVTTLEGVPLLKVCSAVASNGRHVAEVQSEGMGFYGGHGGTHLSGYVESRQDGAR